MDQHEYETDDEDIEEDAPNTAKSTKTTVQTTEPTIPAEKKLVQLPLSRIKNIMKLDREVTVASSEVVLAVTKSVELFIQSLAREAFIHTAQSKKKTVQKTDVELAISSIDSLVFLDGALNF